jgi:putative flippase GtrA
VCPKQRFYLEAESFSLPRRRIRIFIALKSEVPLFANSYFWNTIWTFRRQAQRTDLLQKRVGFAAQGLLNIGVNNGLFWVTVGWLAATPLPVVIGQNIAKVISTVIASALSFLLLRHVVLKPRSK